MSKLLGIVVVVLVLAGVWELWSYWQTFGDEKAANQRSQAAVTVTPDRLPGLDPRYEASLKAAKDVGAAGLRAWLKKFGRQVEDPRKAWIELDYVELLSPEDPSEARKLFAEVKARVPASSPVQPRIKQLEKTYR